SSTRTGWPGDVIVAPRHHARHCTRQPAKESAMTTLPDPARPLALDDATAAFAAILDGTVDDEAVATFLITLSDRGETSTEIAAAAREMRARLVPIQGRPGAIDVCGTGGDGHHTLNVS